MTYLVIGLDKNLKATRILGASTTVEGAGKIGDESKATDFVVTTREKLSERSGPELAALFNALSAPADRVEKFENKERAVARTLAAWDALPEDQQAAPRKRKAPKEPKQSVVSIKLLKAGVDKIWHKASRRKQVYDLLVAMPDLDLDDALKAIATKLDLAPGQVRAAIGKLAADKLVALK